MSKQTCRNALCNAPVNEDKSHVRLNEIVFCGLACLNEWMATSTVLMQAANPHVPVRRSKRPWWET